MFHKILVATDGSPPAECAARAAICLARGGGAQLVAFSVARPYARLTGKETRADIEATLCSAHQAAIGHAARVAALAHEAGVPCQTVTAISAFPGDEIIHAAEQNACDLIALGAHGERTVPPVLAGGVAQQVLAYSPVPVLVLREAGKPDHPL